MKQRRLRRHPGDTHSSIGDAKRTLVMQKRIAKVLAWCDNERGYSSRLVGFAKFVTGRGL
jgi:glyceraldehyde-3-phosphate dehydrogenase/erythrose-4-phosphate dehydrogenase